VHRTIHSNTGCRHSPIAPTAAASACRGSRAILRDSVTALVSAQCTAVGKRPLHRITVSSAALVLCTGVALLSSHGAWNVVYCLLSAAWHVVCCLQPELPRFPSAATSAAPSFLSREPIRHTHHEGCTQCRPFSSSWGLTLPPRLSHLSHHAADCALELDLRSRLADDIRAPSPRLASPRLTSRFVLRASCGCTALVLAL
jgi:hypothetical protein